MLLGSPSKQPLRMFFLTASWQIDQSVVKTLRKYASAK